MALSEQRSHPHPLYPFEWSLGRLTNHSSEPLAALLSRSDFMRNLPMFTTIALIHSRLVQPSASGLCHGLIRLLPRRLTLAGPPIYVARFPAAPLPVRSIRQRRLSSFSSGGNEGNDY